MSYRRGSTGAWRRLEEARRIRDFKTVAETTDVKEDITAEALEFLRTRLENHSFSITHKTYPLLYSLKGEAKVNEKAIIVPLPNTFNADDLEYCYAMQIHESAHVLFNTLDIEKVLALCKKHSMVVSFAMDLFNIVEDYRVNILIGLTHPGAGRLLDSIHRKCVERRMMTMGGPFTSAKEALLPALCGYPCEVDFNTDQKEKFDKAYELSKDVVTDVSLDSTLKILPSLYEIFKDEAPPEAPPEEEEGEDEGEGEEFDGGESDGGGSGDESVADDDYSDLRESRPRMTDREVEKNIKKAVKKLGKKPIEKHIEEMKKTAPKEFKDVEKTLVEAKKIQEKSLEKERKKIELLKAYESSLGSFTHRIEKRRNEPAYKKMLHLHESKIRYLVRDIKTKFLFTRGYVTGQRSGKINGRKIHRVITNGDTQVFRKRQENKEVGDIAVLLLMDMSGSMRDKVTIATHACVIFHEVFKRLKIKHMIVGYTADLSSPEATDHIIFKHWNDTLPAYNIPYLAAVNENRDGATIRMGAQYFREIPERHKLMIVVSDGSPSAQAYRGDPAIKDTVQAQKEVVKKGIKLINIGIGDYYYLPLDYVNRVKCDNIENLPKTFLKVLARELR